MKVLKNVTERKKPEKETHELSFGSEMGVKFVQHKPVGSPFPALLTEGNETLMTEGMQALTTENRKF